MEALIAQYGIETVVAIVIAILVFLYASWEKIIKVVDRYYPAGTRLSDRVKRLEDEADCMRMFRRNMMRETIRSQHRDYMAQGYISEEDLEHFELTYEGYSDNGGNGTARRWYEEVKNLPRQKEGKHEAVHDSNDKDSD